jgi:uncharacterized short protein YbdD (DUF466 family)
LGFRVMIAASRVAGPAKEGEDDWMAFLADMLRALWNYLRDVSGENDYARYRRRMFAEGGEPVSKREFYDQRQQEKYSRPNRCC